MPSGKKKNQPQVARLLVDLENKDSHKQLQAIKTLGEQKILQAVPMLVNLLGNIFDPYHSTQRELMKTAIWALGEIGDPKAIPLLIDTLDNAFYKIQTTTLTALGKLRAEAAVEPVWQIVEDTHSPQFVQLAAIETLGAIANKPAGNYLQKLVENSQINPLLKEKAAQMLHSIQGFW